MIIPSQKARIFDVQRGSMNDGPGIRTTLFFSSCPLRCKWCHNPESWIPDNPGIQDSVEPVSGGNQVRLFSMTELVDLVLRDQPYYEQSGGGVTLSGGEPMEQFSFVQELLRELSGKGIHTCLDTSGYSSREKFAGILPFTRLFLYDWKITDPAVHQRFTGVDNVLIRENLNFLMQQKAKIILRCPVIPEVNDHRAHFEYISAIAENPAIIAVGLLPYHDLYKGKKTCNSLAGMNETFRVPSAEEMDHWKEFLKDKGVNLLN